MGEEQPTREQLNSSEVQEGITDGTTKTGQAEILSSDDPEASLLEIEMKRVRQEILNPLNYSELQGQLTDPEIEFIKRYAEMAAQEAAKRLREHLKQSPVVLLRDAFQKLAEEYSAEKHLGDNLKGVVNRFIARTDDTLAEWRQAVWDEIRRYQRIMGGSNPTLRKVIDSVALYSNPRDENERQRLWYKVLFQPIIICSSFEETNPPINDESKRKKGKKPQHKPPDYAYTFPYDVNQARLTPQLLGLLGFLPPETTLRSVFGAITSYGKPVNDLTEAFLSGYTSPTRFKKAYPRDDRTEMLVGLTSPKMPGVTAGLLCRYNYSDPRSLNISLGFMFSPEALERALRPYFPDLP